MLNSKRVRAFLIVLLITAAAPAVLAQKEVRLRQAPAEFQTFYKKFVRAASKRQVSLLATMSHFPFKYGFDAGDEGVWTRRQFVAQAGDILRPVPSVFRQANPRFMTSGGDYTLMDPDNASYYSFKKRGGVYKFVSYIVEP